MMTTTIGVLCVHIVWLNIHMHIFPRLNRRSMNQYNPNNLAVYILHLHLTSAVATEGFDKDGKVLVQNWAPLVPHAMSGATVRCGLALALDLTISNHMTASVPVTQKYCTLACSLAAIALH